MQTIDLPVSKLKLWDKNPRQITEQDFEKLKASLEKNPEFLQKRPLLVNNVGDEYIVYAGNMRLRAAKALKWKTIPCIIEENIPEERMDEEGLRDNVSFGIWDVDLLTSNFSEEFLRDLPSSVSIPGLSSLLAGDDEKIEEETPSKKHKVSVQCESEDDVLLVVSAIEALKVNTKIKTS